ncbi:MAG: hypothetical protein V3T05_05370 [Myxococcota bacterium]
MTGATLGSLLATVIGPMVSQATMASPGETDMLLTLTVNESPMAPDLATFLSERALDTWDVEVRRGPVSVAAADRAHRHFRVTITWPAERSVEVRIADRYAVLAERILVVTDPGAAKLTVWMMIKSTIKRATKHAMTMHRVDAVPVEPPPREVAAADLHRLPMAPAPVGEVVGPTLTVDDSPVARPWSLAALMTFSLGSSRLFSVGPGFGVRYRTWKRLQLGAEVGYRLAPGVVGLIIHHIPLRVDAGWGLGSKRAVTVGAAAIADLKIPVAQHRSRAVVGVDVGPFLELRMALARPGAGFTLRGTFRVRPVRQRYIIDTVETGVVLERPWDLTLSTGVVWP